MVFTIDLAARENIVNPVGELLEIFVTPSSSVRHVQIMATNGPGYQVQRTLQLFFRGIASKRVPCIGGK